MEQNKKQKKNKNKGRKTLAFLLVGLFVMAFATAGIVNYLSNTVEADVDIESPFSVKLSSDGSDWKDTNLNLGTVYGGSTIEIFSNITNRANNELSGNIQISLKDTSGDDMNGSEISTLEVCSSQYLSGASAGQWYDCHELDTSNFQTDGNVMTIETPHTATAGDVDEDKVIVTFNPAMETSNYKVGVKVTP